LSALSKPMQKTWVLWSSALAKWTEEPLWPRFNPSLSFEINKDFP